MKEPIEYLGNVNSFTTREELYNIGKQMQNDAYNEAIIEAVKNVTIDIDRAAYGHELTEFYTPFYINKNSILKLFKNDNNK